MPVLRDRVILVILMIAAVVRLAGMFDDFWLDEIWSYYIATRLDYPTDVLLSDLARVDNNHPLNTLLIWAIGQQGTWWTYRVPALLAGVGSVLAAAAIMHRRGRAAAILAALLIGFSYPLVFYSCEARGYSLAVFFALLAFAALDKTRDRHLFPAAATFGAACTLGFLSHLTFVHFYAGAAVLSAYRFTRANGWKVAAGKLAAFHAVPLASLVALYLTFVRHLTIKGAPLRPAWQTITESIAALTGFDGSFELQLIVVGAAALAIVWIFGALRRSGSDLWILLLVTVLLCPAALLARQLIVSSSQPIAPRYFLVAFTFLLLCSAEAMAGAMLNRRARWTVIAVAVVLLSASAAQTAAFVRIGRGHYSDAVVYMSQQTPGATIAVLADHPARTGMVLDFYRRVLPPQKQMVILNAAAEGPLPPGVAAPTWWIIHRFAGESALPASLLGANGAVYVLDRKFDSHGLSGYAWYLYRKAPSAR